jgi:sulfoxide reductase catalytic subunit YedY
MGMRSEFQSGDDKRITPPDLYFNRRAFLKGGLVAATAVATGSLYRRLNRLPPPTVQTPELAGLEKPTTSTTGTDNIPPSIARAYRVDEPQTSFQSITHYNNFYEFSTDKDGVADAVGAFSTQGWKVVVDGMVQRPTTLVDGDPLGGLFTFQIARSR